MYIYIYIYIYICISEWQRRLMSRRRCGNEPAADAPAGDSPGPGVRSTFCAWLPDLLSFATLSAPDLQICCYLQLPDEIRETAAEGGSP